MSGTAPAIIYSPAGEEVCKEELLIKKKATIIWKYRDGHAVTKTWTAKNFSAKSNLRKKYSI